jgi:hypothetical protein
VLAAERMGRMVITYDHGFRIRPGRPALLVCPDYDCPYQEPVEIAATPDDAIPFEPTTGGHSFFHEQHLYELTFGEVQAELQRLAALYKQTGNPKLPAAAHRWRQHYEYQYWNIHRYLTQSYTEDKEVSLEYRRDEPWLRGKVRGLLHDSFLFERTDTGQTVLVSTADLRSVAFFWDWSWKPGRVDFGDEHSHRPPQGVHHRQLPSMFLVVSGCTLNFHSVTKYGVCRASTPDAAIAQALHIFNPRDAPYIGEFPPALVDRCYRVIRYARIGTHRLQIACGTDHPEYFVLRTRDLAVARELKMNRPHLRPVVRRPYLYWEGCFHRSELDAIEEIDITVRLPRKRRRRR